MRVVFGPLLGFPISQRHSCALFARALACAGERGQLMAAPTGGSHGENRARKRQEAARASGHMAPATGMAPGGTATRTPGRIAINNSHIAEVFPFDEANGRPKPKPAPGRMGRLPRKRPHTQE